MPNFVFQPCRIQMLPEFISVQLANKILSVGKSINFLREICNDNQPFAEKDKIRESFLNADGNRKSIMIFR